MEPAIKKAQGKPAELKELQAEKDLLPHCAQHLIMIM